MWLIYQQYSCPPRWRAAMHLRVTRPFAQCIQPSQKAVGTALRSYLRELVLDGRQGRFRPCDFLGLGVVEGAAAAGPEASRHRLVIPGRATGANPEPTTG